MVHSVGESGMLWIMDDPSVELDQLLEERAAAKAAFDREFKDVAWGWDLPIGGHHFTFRLDPGLTATLYFTYSLACLVAGIICILFQGVFASLGVALVVGALFSVGTFAAQFYAVNFQREQQLLDRMFDDELYGKLRNLAAKRNELERRIERLIDSTPGSSVAKGSQHETTD